MHVFCFRISKSYKMTKADSNNNEINFAHYHIVSQCVRAKQMDFVLSGDAMHVEFILNNSNLPETFRVRDLNLRAQRTQNGLICFAVQLVFSSGNLGRSYGVPSGRCR